jgi:putative membrane protein
LRDLLIRWLVNALALWLAVLIVPGLTFTSPDPVRVLLVAAVFGLVNAVLRPIITMLSCPLVVLTLGLFILVINALMLLATGWLSGQLGLGFEVSGFIPALIGGLLIGLVSAVLTLAVGRNAPRR